MKPDVLLSVVIITYNQEQYIEQTIRCVLAQKTDYPYEIVIGEDCSTDGTPELVRRFQQEYPDTIRVVTSDRNVGLLNNFYRAVKASQGNYVACCGGDDFWQNPEKIQKQVQFLEENPNYGMVHGDGNLFYEERGLLLNNVNAVTRKQVDQNPDVLDTILMGTYPIWPGTILFRKALFDRYYDLDEIKRNHFMMEDMPLWLEIAAHSKIHYFPESFYTYRRVKGTITSPSSWASRIKLCQSTYDCARFYFRKYYDKLKDKQKVEAVLHAYYNRILMDMAMKNLDKAMVRKSYENIKMLAGLSYLSIRDRLQMLSTAFPGGLYIYNWIDKTVFLNILRMGRQVNRRMNPRYRKHVQYVGRAGRT